MNIKSSIGSPVYMYLHHQNSTESGVPLHYGTMDSTDMVNFRKKKKEESTFVLMKIIPFLGTSIGLATVYNGPRTRLGCW